MLLQTTLSQTSEALRVTLPTAVRDAIARSVCELVATGQAARAIGVGDFVPLPILKDVDGQPLDLEDVAAGRPVVLLFIRGGWCPYCHATLRAYAEAVPAIRAAGGVLIAVTPETPERAAETAGQSGSGFTLAADRGNRFAYTLGLASTLPDALPPLYRSIGIDLAARNGDDGRTLPVPATYVLAPCGRVTFAHVDADFTRRAEPEAAVAALRRLAQAPDPTARAA